jgi:hypothetical protein
VPLAVAPGTAAARAPAATIQIENQAQLSPDGVFVTVDYSCPPTVTSRINVSVSQPPMIANGGVTTAPICDDQKHKVTIDASPGIFSPGSASVSASVRTDNATASTQAEITIR